MVKALRSADWPAIVGEVGIGRGTGSEEIVDLLFEEPGKGNLIQVRLETTVASPLTAKPV
jgi:hypothetical protein